MPDQNSCILDFEDVRLLNGNPANIAALRVQISGSFLDTVDRIAAYLQGEKGAVSAKVSEGLSAIPLYQNLVGDMLPGDIFWRNCETTVGRNGGIEVTMSASRSGNTAGPGGVMVRCVLGAVDDIRVRFQEAFDPQAVKPNSKPKMGM